VIGIPLIFGKESYEVLHCCSLRPPVACSPHHISVSPSSNMIDQASQQ
jgi:hypothetical protein